MASLEKLLIQGIRSFGVSDKDCQTMSFVSTHETRLKNEHGKSIIKKKPWPLTIILGENGCGKTTVIECLKYITTGEAPPGTYSGRSFVHDPKMAGKTVVKGVVKLTFNLPDGREYTIQRCLEATQKPKSLSIKTLSSTITRLMPDGSKESLDSKCADFNASVLDSLGVSRSILNYVVFCHQEDSNWPMEEGSKVKAKFDEIFSSNKYQNCLKNIKDVAKQHRDEIRLEKNELEYLESNKKAADEKKSNLEDKKYLVSSIREEIKAAEETLKPLIRQLEIIKRTEMDYEGIIRNQEKAKTLLKEKANQIQDIESRLNFKLDANMTDDEVLELENEVRKEIRNLQGNIKEIRDEIVELKRMMSKDEREITIKTGEVAEARSLQKTNNTDKLNLNEKIAHIAKQDSWNEEDMELSFEDLVNKAMTTLRMKIKEAEENLKSVTQNMDLKINDVSSQIGELEKKKALSEEKKNRLNNQIKQNKVEIQEINTKLRKTEDAVEKLEEVKADLEKKEQELSDIKSKNNLDDLRNKVASRKSELKDLESRAVELKEEKEIIDSNQKIMSELSLKEAEKSEKKALLDKLERKTKPILNDIFSKIPSLATLKEKFISENQEVMEEKKSTQDEIITMKHDLNAKEDKKRQLRIEIKDLESKIEKFKEKVIGIVDSEEDIEDEISKCKVNIPSLEDEVAKKEAKMHTYKEFIQIMKEFTAQGEDPACPCCKRAFQSISESDELISDLKDEIKNIPQRVKAIKINLINLKQKEKDLERMLPEKEQVDEFKNLKSLKQTEIKKLENDIRQTKSELEFKEGEISKVLSKSALCEEVMEKVFELDNIYRQVSEAEEKLQNLRQQNTSIENVRTLEEFKKDEDSVSRKILAARREIDAKQNREMEIERKTNQLQTQINKLTQEKLSIETSKLDVTNLESRKKELENNIDEDSSNFKNATSQVTSFNDEIIVITRNKNKLLTEKNTQVEIARKSCNKAELVKKDVESLVIKIENYENGGNDAKLEEKTKIVRELVSRKQKNENTLKKKEESRENGEKQAQKKNDHLRDIQENKRLRELIKTEKEQRAKVEKYNESLKTLNYDSELERKKELIGKYEEIDSGINIKKGRLNEMITTIRELEKELASSIYKNAYKKFKEKSIKHRIRQHAIQDLEKYYKALSHAITSFHKERMRIINDIIRDLWRSTYRGNDIDYIEIKTDDFDPSADMEKRKTCNYRVVMIKNQTEMEMRGRCSAGQKVLACILIRLALAETFSTNCGIIALDEPTTNLDTENITSLSTALAEIVEKRSHLSKNFQLIVITHDEDFIQTLGRRVQDVPYYYKVSRNERGLSKISKFRF